MSLPEAVFFDLDGTLLDTAPDFETAINRVLHQEGRPSLDTRVLKAWVSDGSPGIVRSAFNIDDSHADFERLRQALLSEYYACLTERTRIFPGLESTLDFLDEQQIPWGLVTNKPARYAEPIVNKLLPKSAVLICPDHVTQTKPDPEGLFMACESVGVNAKNCIYLGDHVRDIEAGKAANMKTIAVDWGYINRDLEHPSEWNADYLVTQTKDLLAVVQLAFHN